MLVQHMTDVFQKGLDNVLDNGGDISVQSKLSIRSLTSFEIQPEKLSLPHWALTSAQSSLLLFYVEAGPQLAVGKTASDLSCLESLDCSEFSI